MSCCGHNRTARCLQLGHGLVTPLEVLLDGGQVAASGCLQLKEAYIQLLVLKDEAIGEAAGHFLPRSVRHLQPTQASIELKDLRLQQLGVVIQAWLGTSAALSSSERLRLLAPDGPADAPRRFVGRAPCSVFAFCVATACVDGWSTAAALPR